ncbi:ABC transporter substrate-binding protein [Glutamicibacter sp. MNS18]|uniref:ABC transporter substrate-binding protein n=1 Tax=Glutamicibacter sp. MNS18 TaxID=2989817 RepID=UPI0022365AE4|nr:ABC transporter substrate-binding protein [Glutamicibacter sp. MNS18]MCW4465677.1 ABC transporter substrate-binding protein [Glutamicibacter sp. MNS18]
MKISPRYRLAAAVLALSLLATGCSAGANPTDGSATTGEQAQGAEGTTTVDTAFGEVTIPTQPYRIIALEGGTVASVEAGFVPVATAGDAFDDSFGNPNDYESVAELPIILSPDGWDYEQIVELKPDLMIGFVRGGGDESQDLSAEKQAEFDKLNAIAPTVLIRSNGSATVRDASVQMSAALGAGQDAEAAKQAYEDKVGQVSTDYADALAANTFAAVDAYEDVTVYSKISWIGKVLDDLGAPAAKVVASEEQENGVFLSFEQLSGINDATVLFYPEYLDGVSDAQGILEGQATWGALDVVKAGNTSGLTHFFPDNYGAALRVVEQIEEVLKGL